MKRRALVESILWVLFLVALLFGVYMQLSMKQRSAGYLVDAAKRFERYLAQEDRVFRNWLKDAQQLQDDDFESWYAFQATHPFRGKLHVLKGDSLVFWNNNRITTSDIAALDSGLVFLDNLVGYVFVAKHDVFQFKYLVPIRDDFNFQNQYLRNDYYINFDGVGQVRLEDAEGLGQEVKAPNGKVAFKIRLTYNQRFIKLVSYEQLSGICFLLAILFAIALFFLRLDRSQVQNKPMRSLLEFVLPLVVIRFLLFIYSDRIGLSSIELFDPQVFASHWLLPSFGDLLLHLLLLVFIYAYLFAYKDSYHRWLNDKAPLVQSPGVFLFFSFIALLFFLVSLLVARDLVFSSNIPIGLNLIFDYDSYTYLAIVTYVLLIGINASTFYLLNKYLFRPAGFWKCVMTYLLIMGVVVVLFSFTGEKTWLANYWLWWVFLGVVLLSIRQGVGRFARIFYVITAVLCLFVGFQVSEALYKKQIEQARYTARKIFAPNDPTAIYMLLDLVPKLQSDDLLRTYASGGRAQERLLQSRLTYEYLNGYLEKYLLFEAGVTKGQFLPVDEQLDLSEELQQVNRFNLLRQFKQTARQGYSLRVPFLSTESTIDTLLIRILQKTLKPESPFPNLLIEDGLVRSEAFNSFSFALYENDQLIQQGGKYPYRLNDDIWLTSNKEQYLMNQDGLSHFIYKPDGVSLVVVSFQKAGVLSMMAAASGLYLLSILVFFAFNRLVKTRGIWGQMIQLSYRNRIEIALIGSVIVIMLGIGYTTVTYTVLRRQFNTEELITSRLQDIQAAVESKMRIRNGKLIVEGSNRYELSQVAASLSSDFSIFDLDGRLVFSSQSKLFDRKLISELAQPEAYYQVTRLQQTIYLQSEAIGLFNFKSAYVPLRDSKSQLIGMLHMPSFDTDTIERADLNAFVGNLVSLYIIILLVAGLIVSWLASRITSPIQLLTQVMNRAKLGERDGLQAWKRKDEIGELIRSYNEMVLELDRSARLLANTERESAWREMARQIAHEIRNPLTPMKLKLQRLLRDYAEHPDRFKERFKAETTLVLEQIDVLAAVAGEFGSFAQVQLHQKMVIDLREVLVSVVRLQEQSGTVLYEEDLPEAFVAQPCHIFGDAQQIQRAFQNLVQNGLQAVPEDREALILVKVTVFDGYFEVLIRDNGTGIKSADREKIFQPNFTTKSSGMGLGLAIMKKIVDQNDGFVRFETTEGEGTRFYVRFPIHRADT
jgi:signal transduction histidine kinase